MVHRDLYIAVFFLHALKSRWGVFLAVAAGLLPLFWMEPGFVAKSEDFLLPLTFERWLGFFSTWAPDAGLGASPDDRLPAVFFLFWPALFRGLGFSIELAQRLQFTTWFMAAGLAMYFLVSRMSSRELVRAGAVFIYLFNFYQEPMWQGVNIANLSAYVALPLMLGVAIQAVRNGSSLWVSAGQMALASVIGSGVASNPPMALLAILPIPIYLLLFIVHRLVTRKPVQAWWATRFSLLALVLVLLANAYWLVPQVVGLLTVGPSEIFKLAGTRGSALTQLVALSASTPALNVLRLQGHWVWYGAFNSTPYVAHAPTLLAAPPAILASVLPIGLALVGLMTTRDRRLLVIGLVGALGLFMSMGVNGPSGFIFSWLWDNVPGFWVIRSPWYKATALTLLGAAPLAGFGIAAIGDWVSDSPFGVWARRVSAGRASRPVNALGPVAIVAWTLLFAAPIVRGDIYRVSTPQSPLPGQVVELPDHLYEAVEWLAEQPGEFRVLSFPPANRMTTDWGFTSYLTPVGELMSRLPVMTLRDPPEASAAIYKALLRGGGQTAVTMLQQTGIRYVMQQDDINNRYFGPPAVRVDDVAQILERQGMKLERTFGPLRFFRVPQEKPRIWTTRTLYLAPFGLDALPPLSELASEAGAAVVLTPRLDPEDAWYLVNNMSKDLRILSFGAETEAFLRLRAQRDVLEIPPGVDHVTFVRAVPGIYEVWVAQSDVQDPLLRSEERLRFQGSVRRLQTRDELMLVNGTKPDLPRSYTLQSSGEWRLVGTAQLRAGISTISLPSPVRGPEPLLVLPVCQRERQQMQDELARDQVLTGGVTQWRAFLRARAEDVGSGPDAAPVTRKFGWFDVFPDDAVDGWMRIAGVHKGTENIVISNPRDEVWSVALALHVRSIEELRSLWVRSTNNSTDTHMPASGIFLVPPGETEVLVIEGITLKPGANSINLYSPDPETELPGRQFVSFEFMFPMQAGALQRKRVFKAVKDGVYRVNVIVGTDADGMGEPTTSLRSLQIDGYDLLPNLWVPVGRSIARGSIWLDKGEHTINIDQRDGVALPVFIGPKMDATPGQVGNLQTEHVSPTHYRVTASTDKPYVLIMSELFDPRWTALINGREVERHVEVFGYMNGWLIEAEGPHVIDIKFSPQTLADGTRLLSIIVISSMVLALVIGSVVSGRD